MMTESHYTARELDGGHVLWTPGTAATRTVDLPPWPKPRPQWPRLKGLVQTIISMIGGGTALLAISTILLVARLDLPTATFIVLHSRPLNIALAALTAVVPIGLYILIIRSPRLLAPNDPDLDPNSIEWLRQSDFRRALDIVGISLALASALHVGFVYSSSGTTDAAYHRGIVFSPEFAFASVVVIAVGIALALLFLRLATVARRRAGRSRILLPILGLVRKGIVVAVGLTMLLPMALAALYVSESFARRPSLRVVFFEEDGLNAQAVEERDPTSLVGYAARWMAEGDGGYYLLPEAYVSVWRDETGTYAPAYEEYDWTGPAAILWVPGEPLSVAPCDFERAQCIWWPREFDEHDWWISEQEVWAGT